MLDIHHLPRHHIQSRSISAENPTGAPGAGGKESSLLGPGRKGRAYLPLASGDTLTLADIHGAGTIRHIWITVPDATDAGPYVLRDLVFRAYWDGDENPAIEVPLGDFFCNGFATRSLVTSIPIVVAPTGGMNSYLPMPFRRSARLTLESEHPGDIEAVFFQIDYTLGDPHDEDTATLHAQWRRTTGASKGEDHVVVDSVAGRGVYAGTYVGLTALGRYWWGEGELKFYIDGDSTHPTICGTGLEDYAGGAWAFQDVLTSEREPEVYTFSAPYFGYPHRQVNDTTKRSPYSTAMPPTHGLYRWHFPDPIYFQEDLRVTLQQIGHDGHHLFERSDDVTTTAYWYQTGTHAPFPTLPDVLERRPL
ncbi:glycoside hydrolase family 172 protein [uncultured Leifsonia sp.]|uniref:glycoside hydrolase family 172 protein n=1 Tax=uncultured Leifsonia sp. TaxID=340359 RepID=UPI0028D22CB0|nr:glycoside hydrolase family 172 protein [uncultured Leifsonia sp.]